MPKTIVKLLTIHYERQLLITAIQTNLHSEQDSTKYMF